MAKLYFYYGAMGSGKSLALMQMAHNYEVEGFKVYIIKPRVDTKGDSTIVSRIGLSKEVDWVLGEEEQIYSKKEILTD